jgi:hypothetical protein
LTPGPAVSWGSEKVSSSLVCNRWRVLGIQAEEYLQKGKELADPDRTLKNNSLSNLLTKIASHGATDTSNVLNQGLYSDLRSSTAHMRLSKADGVRDMDLPQVRHANDLGGSLPIQ